MKKIFSINKKKLFFFKNLIIKEVKKKNPSFNGELHKIHKFISSKNINSIRLNCFKKINSLDWIKIIKELCSEQMFYLLGQDLLIQSKINLSIQMPKDRSSILKAHSDCWSADTPFQLNLWLPLTDAFSTNSMFIMDDVYSLKYLKKNLNSKYKNHKIKKPLKKNFISMKYGQALIFNPSVLHGNVLNQTTNTRVSLNVRFKSIFAPEPNIKNPDRKFGTYYKKFNILESTSFGLDMIENGIIK